MRRRSEDSIYTYTVYSNCEGGSVLFDSQPVGVVKGGVCVVELTKKDSFTVRVNGGLPSNSTFTSESYTQYTTDRLEYTIADINNSVVNLAHAGGNDYYFLFHLTMPDAPTTGVVQKRNIQSVWVQPFTEVYFREYNAPSSKVIYPGGSVDLLYSYDDIKQETIMGEPELLREIQGNPTTVINYQPLRMTFEPGGRAIGQIWSISDTSIDFSNSWNIGGFASFTANRTVATLIESALPNLDVYIKCIIDDFIYDNNKKVQLYKEFLCTQKDNA